jgi:hypothetical protein
MNNVADEGNYDEMHTLLDNFKCDLNELFVAIDCVLDLREPVKKIKGTINNVALDFDVIKQLFGELTILLDEDYGIVDSKVSELEIVFINTKYYDKWVELEKCIRTFDVDRATKKIEALLQLVQADNN